MFWRRPFASPARARRLGASFRRSALRGRHLVRVPLGADGRSPARRLHRARRAPRRRVLLERSRGAIRIRNVPRRGLRRERRARQRRRRAIGHLDDDVFVSVRGDVRLSKRGDALASTRALRPGRPVENLLASARLARRESWAHLRLARARLARGGVAALLAHGGDVFAHLAPREKPPRRDVVRGESLFSVSTQRPHQRRRHVHGVSRGANLIEAALA